MSSVRYSWVWLTGAMCSPIRLPLALLFSLRGGLKSCRNMQPPKPQDWTVFGLAGSSFLAIFVTVALLDTPLKTIKEQNWVASLVFNLVSYSAIFVPGLLVLKYVTKTNFLESGPQPKCLGPAIRLCFFGNTDESIDDSVSDAQKLAEEAARPPSEWRRALHLMSCFLGLHVSYLTWGVLQEKIITRQYVDSTGHIGQFKDSQFLVFVNRIMAFAVALLYITFSRQPRHKAPLYKYSYCSMSNILSSWCQYEALKFISFPTQVLAKASKIIPVMVMGWIVSRKTYEKYEYVVAMLISVGMFLFLSGTSVSANSASSTTTLSGFILLVGYMSSDAFTTNWQKELFNVYNISPFQAMCGVNLFSCMLTSVSLLQQGAFFDSLVFMSQFPKFTFDCVVLSFCSAFGQLFIYHTIKVFGPVVFIIIMTLRQLIAILLSCFIYGHEVTVIAGIGIMVVFSATFLNIYCGYRQRKKKSLLPKDQSVVNKA